MLEALDVQYVHHMNHVNHMALDVLHVQRPLLSTSWQVAEGGLVANHNLARPGAECPSFEVAAAFLPPRSSGETGVRCGDWLVAVGSTTAPAAMVRGRNS